MTIWVWGFCSISPSVSGKNNTGFSDLPLDAVRCFSDFSPENMRFNNLNRLNVFSDFFRVFGFDRKLFRFCAFLLLFYGFAEPVSISGIPAPGIPSDWSVLTADINTEILNPLTCE